MNTLHVLGAVLILSITALNAQRHQIDIRQSQTRSEIEMRATGLGSEILERLASLPFDSNAGAVELWDLTLASNFGGALSLDDALDLDDVHGLSFTASTASGGSDLEFEVRVSVRYVEPLTGGFVPTAVRSRYKEVTLGLEGPVGAALTLQRVYAHGG